jgi:LmbE family N-acetylglucosaminyl deacetylase
MYEPSENGASSRFKRRVLCIGAHPDDEVLGVGGTLARHADAGGEVYVLIFSEGEEAKVEAARSVTRVESALAAAAVLGVRDVSFFDFPDQKLDVVPFIDVIKPIEAALQRLRPEVVYTHHGGDANTDHQLIFKATYAACRPMTRIAAPVERLLTFETPSSTDQAPQIGEYIFGPNAFVDVEPVWEKKLRALACYGSELVDGVHPRSYDYVDALARMRGGYAGMRYAEAFSVVRERLT